MRPDLDSALALIESVSDYRVLFVGDTIIDEYHYVEPLGKSPKENLIPLRFKSQEVFEGGVGAAANHASSFCDVVDVCSRGTATRKVRMVDATYMRKLAEVHYDAEPVVNGALRMDYDAVVVTDFGHGAIRRQDIGRICRDATFLAVNAQTNSSNIGFNLITKYPSADYIVIDEPEARLAASDRDSPIEDVIARLSENRCQKFVVTLGTGGAIGYDGSFYRQPAMTDRVIDTMGAGDAFFAVTAPMARAGEMKDLLLIGNAAGALKTQIVGHRKPVQKQELIDYLKCSKT